MTRKKRIDFLNILKMNKEDKKIFLFGIFISSVVVANFLGAKTTEFQIGKFDFTLPLMLFTVPLILIILDSITEVFGKNEAQKFVVFSLFPLFLSIVITSLSVVVKPSDLFEESMGGTFNFCYTLIYSKSIRLAFATIISFFISQNIDIYIYHKVKKMTKGKHLWFRNNLSNIISELMNTFLFIFLAFYQIAPEYTVEILLGIIISWWVFKIVASAIFTPFVYFLVKWLKRSDFEYL